MLFVLHFFHTRAGCSGCGCGIISVLAAKKGAVVISTDINPDAVSVAGINAAQNGVAVEAIHSDLFQKISSRKFDFIVINPPYYPKAPQNIAETAWYCGEHFEYFDNLFHELPQHFTSAGKAIMILSEDCELHQIGKIAAKNEISLFLQQTRKVLGESNFIYDLTLHGSETRNQNL